MRATAFNQRLLRGQAPSYERLQARLAEDHAAPPSQPQAVHCGWGRLLFTPTFDRYQDLLDDQELDSRRSTGAIYWEGAVRLLEGGRELGRGYLEMTGYAGALAL